METTTGTRTVSPLNAIRRKCLDCSCGSSKEVELCTVTRCDLHPFRFGKRPTEPVTRAKAAVTRERLEALQKANAARAARKATN